MTDINIHKIYDNLIIIPYRKREEHLNYYLNYTVPLLKNQIPNGKIIIVEQDWTNDLFNRGCLLNIGVNEYKDRVKYIITHDVDINPFEKTIEKYYVPDISENYIKGIYNLGDGCDTLGGIIKMHTSTFLKMNGFPNDIWGWGAEDFALKERAKVFNIKTQKNIRADGLKLGYNIDENVYFKIFNNINDRVGINNGRNIHKYTLINKTSDGILNCVLSSGLNNLKYKILERKSVDDYVELIKVSI
jgi:hypothetical protein